MSDKSGDRKNPLFFRNEGGTPPPSTSSSSQGRPLSDSGKVSTGGSGKIPASKLVESGKVAVTETPTEYRSGMTSKAAVLALLPISMAVLLISEGVSYNGKFVAADTSRYPFVFGPIAMGLFILVAMVFGARKQLRQRLVVARKEVIYDGGHEDVNFSSSWGTLAYSPPQPGKRLVRSLLISDGKKFAQFYDIFTPGFDKLVADLNKRKDQVSMASGRMRMDGGRIQM